MVFRARVRLEHVDMSARIRTLLVDDERLARAELRRLLAVHPQIEIVGEATHAQEALAALAHAENAWRPIIAQRHILAHEYGEIEHDLIWRVATVHVPVLQRQLLAILPAGQ